MKVWLLCVGRLGDTPEARLARDYAARATAAGRSLALGPVEIVEVEPRGTGKAAESAALLKLAAAAPLIACDEHGDGLTSRTFAELLGQLRDEGERELAIVVGGADGLGETVLSAATRRLAFGALTWPHALARAMLAEQVYRAATILGGSPYHRD